MPDLIKSNNMHAEDRQRTDATARGIASRIKKLKPTVVAPQEDEARGLSEKERNISEYQAAMAVPKEEKPSVPSAADRVNPSAAYGSRPGEQRIDTSEMLKPLYDKGGAIPRISLNDGKHTLIVAEDGERVLTPAQNRAYERTHPNARKTPMLARVYDDSGVVNVDADGLPVSTRSASAIPVIQPTGPAAPPKGPTFRSQEQREYAANQMPGQEPVNTTTTPLMDQMYDRGGNVKVPKINLYDEGGDVDAKGTPADSEGPVFPEPASGSVRVSDSDQPLIAEPTNADRTSATMTPASSKSNLPTIESPVSSGATDHPMTPQQEQAKNEASVRAAGLPVMHADSAAPDLHDIIRQDKMEAAQRGSAGLADLGTSLIHENVLNAEMPTYTGPGKPVPTGELIPAKQLPTDIYKFKQTDLDRRIELERDKAVDENATPEDRAAARTLADQLEYRREILKKPGPTSLLGKIGHVASEVGQAALRPTMPYIADYIPGSEVSKARERAGTLGRITTDIEEEKKIGETENASSKSNVGKTPPELTYHDLLTGGPNGTPRINPDTQKPFTALEANVASQGTGKTPIELATQDYMRQTNPETGHNYTRTEAWERAMQVQTGTRMNEQQRRIADYLSANKMEDTPTNRDAARVAIEKRDVVAKAASSLPFAERKASFNNQLATAKAQLLQANADAYSRGLKADELQQVENAKYEKTTSAIDLAKENLKAADTEQFAANIMPVVALLTYTSEAGVKRVNKQELDKFVPAEGSFGRWIEAHADKFMAGEIPDAYRNEVGSMLNRIQNSQEIEHSLNTRSIDNTVRQGAQTPVQTKAGGASAKPAPSKPQAIPDTVPKDATHVYRDKQNKVVGYAQGGTYHKLGE